MKSIHTPQYGLFCRLLREVRMAAELSQVALAERLQIPQAYVSAFELGKTRQDFIQIHAWCSACGITVAQLATTFDERWAAEREAANKASTAKIAKNPKKRS